MASYFSYFPNVYVGEGVTDDESTKYRLVKNIFRRARAREDLNKYTTLFEAYEIEDGDTASSITYKLFDDETLDWTIYLINDIVDVYDQWPKKLDDLQSYTAEKYENPDAVHHWETNEILYDGLVYIKEGIEVNETYRATMPDGTIKSKNESIYAVSNFEHEYYLNEKKRQIVIPVGSMIDIMTEELEDLVSYEPHNELDEVGNKKTPISLASRFLNNLGSVTKQSPVSTQNISDITFDYGNTAAQTAGVATAVTTTTPATTTTTTKYI